MLTIFQYKFNLQEKKKITKQQKAFCPDIQLNYATTKSLAAKTS